MGTIATTYMELTRPPAGPPLPVPVAGAEVAPERFAFAPYMELWGRVGSPLGWDGRLLLSREAVEHILADPLTDIAVLRVAGVVAGFCEFDATSPGVSEIKYFGLLSEFQGRRLGPYLLDAGLRAHWRTHATRRIWLHTDICDDARALPLYQKAGFTTFARHDLPESATEADYKSAIGM